jgi:hypothetical protein
MVLNTVGQVELRSLTTGYAHQIIHPEGVYYLCDTDPYGVNLIPWILNINDNQLYNPYCLLRIQSGGHMNCSYHLCFAISVLSYHQQDHLNFQCSCFAHILGSPINYRIIRQSPRPSLRTLAGLVLAASFTIAWMLQGTCVCRSPAGSGVPTSPATNLVCGHASICIPLFPTYHYETMG